MKKTLRVAAIGAAIVTLATGAFAKDIELNIYGASAQGKFWKKYAESFLTAEDGMNCDSATSTFQDSKEKLGIAIGTGCQTAPAAGGKVTIRYTSSKSIEGIYAVDNQDPNNYDKNCPLDNEGKDTLRKMAKWSGTGTATTDCFDVHVGAADVASESFTQETHGNLNGTAGDWQDIVLDPENIPNEDTIGRAERPIIVPFSFYKHDSLGIENLTRQQIVLLFSGNVYNYNQFGIDASGTAYPDKKVALCMRHAGSGTHATLDKAIMRGTGLAKDANADTTLSAPIVMFYDSSTDMLGCLNTNAGQPTGTYGAIGYAEADALVKDYNATTKQEITDTTYPNIARVKYNGLGEGMTATAFTTFGGMSPIKYQIKNGQYEFWSHQWMYINEANENEDIVSVFDTLVGYVNNQTLSCPGLGCFWLSAGELNVTKLSDTDVPHF